jgi:uncharacterized cupredoxin-like copper-binding protein
MPTKYCHFSSEYRVPIGYPAKMLPFIFALLIPQGNASAHEKHAVPAKVDYSKAEPMPFGIAADPKKASRTVRISMADTMRYSPSGLKVKRGETVRFLITNNGKVMHELVLGTMDELKKHAELMRKHPGMEHDEPHMAHVAPGKTGEMGWRFTKTGTFYYGCLIPGHFEAGMIGKVVVE